jgi:hypothetical protein
MTSFSIPPSLLKAGIVLIDSATLAVQRIIAIVSFLSCLSTTWVQPNAVVSVRLLAAVSILQVQAQERSTKKKSNVPGIAKNRTVAEPQSSTVELSVDRNVVQTDEEVKFTLSPASLAINSPFIFAFDFGDGTPIVKTTNQAEIVHRYSASGSYSVKVLVIQPEGREIFEPKPEVANSVQVTVNAREPSDSVAKPRPVPYPDVPSRPPNIPNGFPWKYLIIGLLLLFGCFWVWRRRLPRASENSIEIQGTSHTDDQDRPPNIKFQVTFHSDVARGHYKCEKSEASLIRSVKRTND